MSKIQQIIREAIGEDKPTGFIGENSHLDTTFFKQEIGYQQALADLRNKIPELEKKIVDEIETMKYKSDIQGIIYKQMKDGKEVDEITFPIDDIIKNLTS
jgi:hypothetical protein